MGFGGPVDLNFQAVFGYMDRIGIPVEDQEYCFNLVYAVYLKLEETRAEEEAEKKK